MPAKYFICFLVLGWLPWGASCQSRKAVKLYENAYAAYQSYDLATCIQNTGSIVSEYPDFGKAWLLLGQAADESNKVVTAVEAYTRYYQIDSLEHPEIAMRIASLSILCGRYLSGYEVLKSYGSFLTKSGRSASEDYQFLIDQFEFALSQLSLPKTPHVRPLSLINSEHNEYFPAITVDGKVLVYTKQHLPALGASAFENQEDLFLAFMDSAGPVSIQKMPFPLNTINNEGTQAIRQDGRVMFFTACNRPETKGGCDIYQSFRIGENWSEPVNIGYPVNTRYWESTPSLAPDGNTLFFASNRPGGFGGMDIWWSRFKEDEGWSEPENMGPIVNGSGNEMAPFLHGDGQSLYFSSDGLIGMGGLDLFISIKDAGLWGLPKNLGYPINTYADEFGLTVTGDGERGYFSSNRNPAGDRDIYEIAIPQELRPKPIYHVKGTVLDSISHQPIGAVIKVVQMDGTILHEVQADPISGDYLVGIPLCDELIFVVRHSGYLFYSQRIKLNREARQREQIWDILLNPAKNGSVKILRNIFFEFDSAEITGESEAEILELNKFLQANPRLGIEISGHTDNQGSEEYNIRLSQDRANALKKRLLGLGAPLHRIQSIGFGAGKPIASNDTEDGRAVNRRIEIKLIHID